MTEPDVITDYEQGILSNVEKYGCQVTHVFDPDGIIPDFSYSVGFCQTVDQPEVIVFGLTEPVMHFMVNQTLEQCRRGLVLNDGMRISGLLEGCDVIARHVPPYRVERAYLNSAMWLHLRTFGDELTRVLQLVWPGSQNGLYPWDRGCSQEVIDRQPALYQAKLNS